LQEL
jgi:hypothetical protein